MSIPQSSAPQAPAAWFATALGRYVLERELKYSDDAVADVFGYNALQLGLPEHDFLRASRIPFKCGVAPAGPAALRADFCDLPVAANSIDLLLLPHALEFSTQPHQVLREVQRVLMPEGHAIIMGFNPWSLWGLRGLYGRARDIYPWNGHFINLPRLKEWLAVLGLEINGGRWSCCYVPPCTTEKWLRRFAFMEAAGDRWWPGRGGVYFLHVVKRVRGMRVIMPLWREQLARRRNLAVVPKTQDNDEPVAARDSLKAQ